MHPNLLSKMIPCFLFCTLVACSSTPEDPQNSSSQAAGINKPAGPSIEAKQLAAEEETLYVTEISFSRGQANLSPDAKRKLQEMIGQAEKGGDIEAIHVITWADREYPSPNSKKLSKNQQDLAKSRNEQLEKFFETMPGKMKVISHSMAERPGILKELWGGDDVRIKKSLESAGIPNTDTAVKVPAKASKAIIFSLLSRNTK